MKQPIKHMKLLMYCLLAISICILPSCEQFFDEPPVSKIIPSKVAVQPGAGVTLDGSGSYLVWAEKKLDYSWKLISKPTGSAVEFLTLNDSAVKTVSFTPDIVGQYTFSLRVQYKNLVSEETIQIIEAKYPPATPTNLSVTEASSSTLKVSWALVDGATSYELYRDTNPNGGFNLKIFSGNNTQFIDTELSQDTTYYYKVISLNEVGSSSASSHTFGKTLLLPPSPPTLCLFTATSINSITLDWNDTARTTSYQLYRDSSASGSFNQLVYSGTNSGCTDNGLSSGTRYYYKLKSVNTSGASVFSQSFSELTDYPLTPPSQVNIGLGNPASSTVVLNWTSVSDAEKYYIYQSSSQDGVYNQVGITTSTQYSITNLTSNTTYWYYVKSYNLFGHSISSNNVHISTSLAIPNPPSVVYFQNITTSSLSICWTGAASSTGYKIYKSTNNYNYSSSITTATTTANITGLSEGTVYYFWLSSYNSIGESTKIGPYQVTTLPSIPTGLSATKGNPSNSVINIDWNDTQSATKYRLYRSTSYSSGYSDIADITQSYYQDTGLSSNTTYYYKVQAANVSGYGIQSSSPASATTDGIILNSPQNLRVDNKTYGNIMLMWDPVPGAQNYYIYKDSSYYGSSTTPAKTVENLGPYVQYTFQVKAVAGGTEGQICNPISTRSLPGVPTNVNVSPTGPTSVRVSWSSPTNGAYKYRIWFANNSSLTNHTDDVVAGNVYYKDYSGLTSGTTYYAIVRGNADEEYHGNWSNTASGTTTTPTPTITVTSPTGTYNCDDSLPIRWNSTNLSGTVNIRIYYDSSNYDTIVSSTTNDGAYNWTIPANQNNSSNYRIRVSSNSTSAYDYGSYFTIKGFHIHDSTKTLSSPYIISNMSGRSYWSINNVSVCREYSTDYYKFTLTTGGTYRFNVYNFTSETDIDLYVKDAYESTVDGCTGIEGRGVEEVFTKYLNAGTYYIKVLFYTNDQSNVPSNYYLYVTHL